MLDTLYQLFLNPSSSANLSYPNAESINKGNYFKFGGYNIPRLDKTSSGGEDFFCVNKKLISIVDGVGGWNEIGINPGIYSHCLCDLIEEHFLSDIRKYSNNPQRLLCDCVQKNENTGSCTSLIITLDEFCPIVNVSYIGDTKYLIFRPYKKKSQIHLKLIFEAEELCKCFNMPYQVGTGGDDPLTESVRKSHCIKDGDILVCGSDGLFDNLDNSQISRLLNTFIDRNSLKLVDVKLLAENLARLAFEYSRDQNYESPFFRKANSKEEFLGGKEDDITVVIAQVNLA